MAEMSEPKRRSCGCLDFR